MYHHIDKVEEYINRPIIRLKPKPRHNFDYLMFEHIKTKGKNKGQKGYGWALSNVRWCTSKLKEDIIRKYLKKYKNNYIECIGIAFDELERCNLEDSKKKYPLVEWKITEGEALKYCYDKGFNWDSLYTRFDRVSCWCCPFINLKELRNLYMFYPDLWNELKNMDNRSFNSFRSSRTKDGLKLISVQNLEDRFKEEIEKVGLKI